jgi:Holliday junction resolvase RusA-like endonuclease
MIKITKTHLLSKGFSEKDYGYLLVINDRSIELIEAKDGYFYPFLCMIGESIYSDHENKVNLNRIQYVHQLDSIVCMIDDCEKDEDCYKFIFDGIPMSKQSARFAVGRHGEMRGKVVSYQKSSIIKKENDLGISAKEQLPKYFKILNEPIGASILYVFPMLSSFSKKDIEFVKNGGIIYKHTKPDLHDNLNKALFDALEGIVYTNDSRVCKLRETQKIYGINPRIELTIFKLT